MGKLTVKGVEKLVREAKAGAAGDGLYPVKGASWTFRFKLKGRAHKTGLGSVEAVGLAAARDLAQAACGLARNGIARSGRARPGREAAGGWIGRLRHTWAAPGRPTRPAEAPSPLLDVVPLAGRQRLVAGYPFCPGGVAVPPLGARCMALSIIRLQLSIMRVISEFIGVMPDIPPRPFIMP